ncbi:MAG: Fur family transcriptional regulator [Bacteroidia bacterium]
MEISEQSAQLLKQNGLKKTPARLYVLNSLITSKYAISYNILEKETKNVADRITLYRILKSFEQKGIIHKTIDHEGLPKYALCHDNCNNSHHYDNHVHFNCTKCNQTICLDAVDIPAVTLPKGYQIKELSFSINGICKQCAK